MPILQNLLHRAGLVSDSRFIRYVVVFLAVMLLALAYDLRAYKNMSTPEGMDSAQLARNIAEGKGYTTLFVRPFSMHLLEQRSRRANGDTRAPSVAGDSRIQHAHPDIANPPVYPLVLAGLMKTLPFHYPVDMTSPFWSVPDPTSTPAGGRKFWRYEPDFLICIFNEVLLLGVVVLAFYWARWLFDVTVARVAALVLLGTEVLWRFSASGLSTMLLLLIFMGLLWCLALLETGVREKSRGPAALFLLAAATGLLVGAGGLTRYAFAWLILPVLVFLLRFTDSRRVVFCMTAAVAFAASMAPWIIRNIELSGAPLGTATFDVLKGTALFPGHQLERSLDPNVEFYLRLLWLKLFANLRPLLQNDLFRLGSGAVAALFLVGLMIGFRNPALGRMRYFTLLSLGVLILAQALGRTQLSEESPEINSENLLVLLVPLVVIYGVGFFFMLLDRIAGLTRDLWYTIVGLFGVVACLPMIFALLGATGDPVAYPPYYPPQIQQLAGWMKEPELIMSDVPWAVAWYGKRQCVWLPLNVTRDPANPGSRENFFAINDEKPVKALYLTPRTMDGRLLSDWIDAGELSWGSFVVDAVLRREVPSTFPLHEMPAGFSPRAIFLTDAKRWSRAATKSVQ